MTKIAVNRSSGSFRLSPQIVQRMCELRGIPCYFFDKEYISEYIPYGKNYTTYISKTVDDNFNFFSAFTIPNPNELFGIMETDEWLVLSKEEREVINRKFYRYNIETEIDNEQWTRTNRFLIQAIEEIGLDNIEIVEIPDDVEWYIEQPYCQQESIHEKHRVW